jgi:Domain of unknown function (DUF5664)
MKTTEGKLRYELIPVHAHEGLALGFEEGAQKYAPEDWRKLDVETLIGAALRHINKIRGGKVFDQDSGPILEGVVVRVQHAYKAMASLAMVSELLREEIEQADEGGKDVGADGKGVS